MRELARKEILDLIRDPRIWIPALMSFLIMSMIGLTQSITIVQPSLKGARVELGYTGDLAGASAFDQILRSVLQALNITIAPPHSFPKEADALLIINASSVESLSHGGRVQAYLVYKVSPSELGSEVWASAVGQAISQASRLYIAYINNLNPQTSEALLSPAALVSAAYSPERGSIILIQDPGSLGTAVFIQILVITLIALSSLFVLQFSSTSMALENEQKTFEVLLTMPISKSSIVVAKLAGSAVIGALNLAGMGVGMLIYLRLLASKLSSTAPSAQLGQVQGLYTGAVAIPREVLNSYLGNFSTASPLELLLLTPSQALFLFAYAAEAMIILGVLGIIIGALSSDVRMAQTISGTAGSLIMLFSIVTTTVQGDPRSLPLWALLTNPVTGSAFYARLAFYEAFYGTRVPEIPAYLAISTAITILAIYILPRIMGLETLARLRQGAERVFGLRRRVWR